MFFSSALRHSQGHCAVLHAGGTHRTHIPAVGVDQCTACDRFAFVADLDLSTGVSFGADEG
jgi:hypothetical protein